MRRRPPRSTPLYSSAASDVYKRQPQGLLLGLLEVGDQPGSVRGEHATIYDSFLWVVLLGGTCVERHGSQPCLGVLGVVVGSRCQREQIALVLQHLGLEQRAGALPAEGLDVESATGGQRRQPLTQLGGAVPGVGATNVLVALL